MIDSVHLANHLKAGQTMSRASLPSLVRLILVFLHALAQNVGASEIVSSWSSTPPDVNAWETSYGYYPQRSFKSFNLRAPAPRKATDSPACHDGLYTFISPRGFALKEHGNAILDNDGDLVWMHETEKQAYGLAVQEFQGQRYLSYWEGEDKMKGHGQGVYVLLDSSYQEAFRITAFNNLEPDLHELFITKQGTALITIYESAKIDINDVQKPGYLGAPAYIWDCLFQEIDLANHKLLFQWRASDHYGISDTYRDVGKTGGPTEPFDYFHINSVTKDELGNYLISARYTSSVTYIDGQTGQIIWILGGVRNYFRDLSDGAATNFSSQHDARFHALGAFPQLTKNSIRQIAGRITKLLTLFDNAADDLVTDKNLQSRGMLLEVSYPDPRTTKEKTSPNEYTVRLVQSYVHPSHILSPSQGSLQVISTQKATDSKVLLGYGSNAVYGEFAADGTMLCDTRFSSSRSWLRRDVQSYRALKFPWVGRPAYPPSAVLSKGKVFVSWNGATEVERWSVEHSRDEEGDNWSTLLSVGREGFETVIDIDSNIARRFLRVRALDKRMDGLGVSSTLDQGRRLFSRGGFGGLVIVLLLLGAMWYVVTKSRWRRGLLRWLPKQFQGHRYGQISQDAVELENT